MGDEDSNDEHIDVDECINVSRPEPTVFVNPVAPVERVSSLHKCETLNHPNDQSLERGQLEVEFVFAKLVPNDYELENQSQAPHRSVELAHHIDIIQ